MKILHVVSHNPITFKIIIEVLKELLSEANIDFIKNDCMKITCVDVTRSILIDLKMNKNNFSTFRCKNKLSIGVSFTNFYKFINSVKTNDKLHLYIDNNNINNLAINIKQENRVWTKKSKMALLEISSQDIKIPKDGIQCIITMNSSEFHDICKELQSIGDYIEIRCNKDKILFKTKGIIGEQVWDSTNMKIKLSNNSPLEIYGIYELKKIASFSKLTKLSVRVRLFMKNNFPLILKYDINDPSENNGEITIALAPICEDTMDANYSDEDEFYEDEELKLII